MKISTLTLLLTIILTLSYLKLFLIDPRAHRSQLQLPPNRMHHNLILRRFSKCLCRPSRRIPTTTRTFRIQIPRTFSNHASFRHPMRRCRRNIACLSRPPELSSIHPIPTRVRIVPLSKRRLHRSPPNSRIHRHKFKQKPKQKSIPKSATNKNDRGIARIIIRANRHR